MPETRIERAEQQRDIKAALTASQGLDREEEQELIFKETSPRRRKTTIYHVRNGQPAEVPEYMAVKALDKIDPDTGTYMFTADPAKAAEFQPGTTLCFLHDKAPDQPILEELGLTAHPCKKSNLGNMHSKRMHGIHKHHDEWEAYQALMEDKQKAEDKAAQRAQLDATLALAGKAASVAPVASEMLSPCPEEGCNYQGTSAQIRGHKSVHNKAEAATATS